MEALGKKGVLVLASITGGNQTAEVPAAKINQGFVLGNKVMVGSVNGNRDYFEAAVRDLAMAQAQYPGWVERLLTHPIQGLDNYRQLIDTLTSGKDLIKAFCEIAPLDSPVETPAYGVAGGGGAGGGSPRGGGRSGGGWRRGVCAGGGPPRTGGGAP